MLDKAHGWFRDWFRKVWNVRGGGLYACGYALTFIYFEVTTIFGEIVESESIGSFFSEQLVEFFLRFAGDSLQNLIKALMWPAFVAQWQAPVGAIALGAAFVAFPKYLKKPITGWLFDETNQKS